MAVWLLQFLSLLCHHLCDFGQSASLWPSTSLFIKYEGYLTVTWGSETCQHENLKQCFSQGCQCSSPPPGGGGEKGLWFLVDSPKIQSREIVSWNHRILQFLWCPGKWYRIRDWPRSKILGQQSLSLELSLFNCTHWLRWGTLLRQIFSWGPGYFWSGENTCDKLFFFQRYMTSMY